MWNETRSTMAMIASIAVMCTACSTKDSDGDGTRCALTSCPNGYVLDGNNCIVGCGECPTGQGCIGGTCLPPGGAYPGGMCSTADECPTGMECTPYYPSHHGVVIIDEAYSHCTLSCGDGCPDGAVCYRGMCHRPCNPLVADSCCDPELRCYAPSDADTGICMEACNIIVDLGYTYICDLLFENTCDMESGICVDQMAPPCTPGEAQCHEESVLRCSPDRMMLACEEHCTGMCADGHCIDCTPHDHLGCSAGDVYWYDSCGEREGVHQECGSDERCIEDECTTGPSCDIECEADGDDVLVSLSCGSGSRECTYGHDSYGRVSFISCTYDNGTSFTCSIDYNSLGQPTGSCTGEGDTCYFF